MLKILSPLIHEKLILTLAFARQTEEIALSHASKDDFVKRLMDTARHGEKDAVEAVVQAEVSRELLKVLSGMPDFAKDLWALAETEYDQGRTPTADLIYTRSKSKFISREVFASLIRTHLQAQGHSPKAFTISTPPKLTPGNPIIKITLHKKKLRR